MATLATCVGGVFLAARNALEMRVLVEPRPDVGMTSPTNSAANIPSLAGFRAARDHCKNGEKKEPGDPGCKVKAGAAPRSIFHDVYRNSV